MYTYQTLISKPEIISMRPIISEPYIINTWWEMSTNPESTMRWREIVQKEPYWIHESPGTSEVQINIPRFFDESLEKQQIFFEKIQSLVSSHQKYNLILNISQYTHIDISKMELLTKNLWNYQSITFEFYDIPENYYDIFDRWYWQNMNERTIIVNFYGQMFPDRFSLDAFILHLSKMIKKTMNDTDKMSTLSIDFNETSDIWFILNDETLETLRNIPTKKLYVERMIINSSPTGPWDTFKWKPRVEKFFRESPIESIKIDRIGEKENGIITLYGF